MFYVALGNLALLAPSKLRARLLERQYVQIWEWRVWGFFLYTLPSLKFAIILEPYLEDQDVQGSGNTRREIAASGNKVEQVGKRKAAEGREAETFICNTFDDQERVMIFFFASLLQCYQFSFFAVVQIYSYLVVSL